MTKEYEYLLYERKGKILRITLNDPGRLNCLSIGMTRDLNAALEEAAQDLGISVVILKGAGRAFCSGYNLSSDFRGETKEQDLAQKFRGQVAGDFQQMINVFDLPIPIIAQVHGYAVAGGCQLASMCDLCVVAEDAIIGSGQGGPITSACMVPAWLPLIGPRKAKEIGFILGSRIDGKEAERLCWANKAVPAERLEEETEALARKVATTPRELLEQIKFAANRAMDISGFRQALLHGYTLEAMGASLPLARDFIDLLIKKGFKEARQIWQKEMEAAVDKP